MIAKATVIRNTSTITLPEQITERCHWLRIAEPVSVDCHGRHGREPRYFRYGATELSAASRFLSTEEIHLDTSKYITGILIGNIDASRDPACARQVVSTNRFSQQQAILSDQTQTSETTESLHRGQMGRHKTQTPRIQTTFRRRLPA